MLTPYDAAEFRAAVREIVNLDVEADSLRRQKDYFGALDASVRASNLRFAMRLRALARPDLTPAPLLHARL